MDYILDPIQIEAAKAKYNNMKLADLRALAIQRNVFPDYGADARATKKDDWVTALALDDVRAVMHNERQEVKRAQQEAIRAEKEEFVRQVNTAQAEHRQQAAANQARIKELDANKLKELVRSDDLATLRKVAADALELAELWRKQAIAAVALSKMASLAERANAI